MKKYLRPTIFAILLLINLFPVSHAQATELAPVDEYIIKAGDSKESEFTYTNDTDQTRTYSIEVYQTNPQDKAIIVVNPQIFTFPYLSGITLRPKEKAQIRYQIKVPATTSLETYFNAIAMVDITDLPKNGAVGTRSGIGKLIRIDVISQTGDVGLSFKKDCDLEVNVLQKGFLGFPLKLEVKTINRSKYVFTPTGSVLALNRSKTNNPYRQIFNPDSTRLYPNNEISQVISADVWRWNNLFSPTNIQVIIQDESGEIKQVTKSVYVYEQYVIIAAMILAVAGIIMGLRSRRKKEASQKTKNRFSYFNRFKKASAVSGHTS